MGTKREDRREGHEKAALARRTPFKPQGYSEGARRGATREKPAVLSESKAPPSDGWRCYLESTGWEPVADLPGCWERDGAAVDTGEPGWCADVAAVEGVSVQSVALAALGGRGGEA